MTIDLKITDEAAEKLTQLAQKAGESVGDYVGEAVATRQWVDERIRGGRLFEMDENGRLREVTVDLRHEAH